MDGPVRRRRLVRPLTAAVVAGLMTLAVWQFWPWREKYPVALPPPAASQRQVVWAYVRSLDAHDSLTALALSAPTMRATTKMWLASTASITDVKMGAIQYDAGQPTGEQYDVPVDFVYRSHWWKDDPSFVDGEHVWGYSLAKIDGRWLITDDGTG